MADEETTGEQFTHYSGTITKEKADGTRVASSFVGPGEKLIAEDNNDPTGYLIQEDHPDLVADQEDEPGGDGGTLGSDEDSEDQSDPTADENYKSVSELDAEGNTGAELEEQASLRGLSTSGTKADVYDRIKQYDENQGQ